MGRAGAEGWRPWWSWVRDLVALVVAVELLAWLVHRLDALEGLLRHWPLFATLSALVLGLVASVGAIYRGGRSRQALAIAGLIVSSLGLVAAPIVYAAWIARLDP